MSQNSYWLNNFRADERKAIVKLAQEGVNETLEGMKQWIKNNPNAPTVKSVEAYRDAFLAHYHGVWVLTIATIITVLSTSMKFDNQSERDRLAEIVKLFKNDKEFLTSANVFVGTPYWSKSKATKVGKTDVWGIVKPWVYFLSLNWLAKNNDRIKQTMGVAKQSSEQRIEKFDNFVGYISTLRNVSLAIPAIWAGVVLFIALRSAQK